MSTRKKRILAKIISTVLVLGILFSFTVSAQAATVAFRGASEYGGKVRHLGAARLYIDSKNDEGYILGAFTHREDRAPVETDLSAL